MHADYLNGWPVNYLKDVFDVRDECRNYGATGTGNQTACTIQLADVDRNKAQNCKQTAAQVRHTPEANFDPYLARADVLFRFILDSQRASRVRCAASEVPGMVSHR